MRTGAASDVIPMPRERRTPALERERRRTPYERDEVLTIEQLAEALSVSIRTIERSDLPTIYFGKRTRRYIYGQVLDVLAKRAQ